MRVLLIASIFCAMLANGPCWAQITSVTIKGVTLPIDFSNPAQSRELVTRASRIDFALGSNPEGASVGYRLSFKMEGIDDHWITPPGEMRCMVNFYDASNAWLGQHTLPVFGTSPGWTGKVEDSPLVRRQEEVPVPEKAVKFALVFTSAGGAEVLGTLALGALQVTTENKTPLVDLKFSGDEASVPDGWEPNGDYLIGARVRPCKLAPQGRVLAIEDDCITGHTDWRFKPLSTGGARVLHLDLLYSFSIGFMKNQVPYAYKSLEPGRYFFRIRKTTALGGIPTGAEQTLAIQILPPYWQQPWFLILSGMGVAGLVFGGIRYVSWRQTQREFAELRAKHALETERARIARDIHDELGASLTRICMLSEEDSSEETRENLSRIHQTAQQITRGMDEIVWALNPRNDELVRLVTFLDAHAEEFLSAAGVEFTCRHAESLPECRVSGITRHNLFLAFKEALTNAVRHGHCRKIEIETDVSDNRLTVSVSDNGVGFDPNQANDGNGLQNMRKRMDDLGGRFSITSSPGSGTRVELEIPI